MDFSDFETLPLLGILRGVDERALGPLADCVASTGLRALEITMNTAQAASKIALLREAAQGRFLVGAGTVLSVKALGEALEAGASFIVMPTLETDVASVCRQRSIPFFPGALTPQEVRSAALAGATMIKIFPARLFGPAYFKELLGPFDNLKLLACGGVDEVTLPRYFSAGASAAAIGGSIFRADWLREGRFDAVEAALTPLVRACRHAVAERRSGGVLS
jgi:2-dehydro-3-deoxyphosphogluconate aldolase/(4S)-4-hydroxy-2-oxoglutarate aldolase